MSKAKGHWGSLAEQFGVSEGWAKKISATRTRAGQMERAAVATWSGEPGDGDGAGVDGGANP